MNFFQVNEEMRKLLGDRIRTLQDENTAFADAVLEYGKMKNDADLLNILLRHTARQQETHRRYMQRLDELTHKLR